jgi:hypothetical protein
MNWRWFIVDKFHHIQFSFQICKLRFKHVFSKLNSLVCVYVHFKIRDTTKQAFIVDSMKIIFDKLAIYTPNNMFNLHKMEVAHY